MSIERDTQKREEGRIERHTRFISIERDTQKKRERITAIERQ